MSAREFDFTELGDNPGESARRNLRQQTLRQNKDVLYTIRKRDGWRSSLIFQTDHMEEWETAFLYFRPPRGDINMSGARVCIYTDSGKLLVFGKPVELDIIEAEFENLRMRVNAFVAGEPQPKHGTEEVIIVTRVTHSFNLDTPPDSPVWTINVMFILSR